MSARPGGVTGPVSARRAGVGVLATVAIGGLLFAPVFTAGELVLPVLAVAFLIGLVDQVALGRRGSAGWRAPLAVAAGAAALAGTVLRGPLTGGSPGATVRAVRTGVVNGWRLTLDSAWPARPEPELILFVPLLVAVAAVVGVELVRRGWPLAALLPGLALAALAQAYAAATPPTALAAGLAYCLAAVLVLAGHRRPVGAARRAVGAALALVAVVAAGGVAGFAGVPDERPAASLRELRQPVPHRSSAVSPLDEISERLRTPDRVVFHHWTDATPDRWPVVVLDAFDGRRWTSAARYHRLGAGRPADPSVTVPTRIRSAQVSIEGLRGPWLPTPGRTVAVAVSGAGPAPLVDDADGTLVAAQNPAGLRYDVRWAVPDAPADRLAGAALDTTSSAAAPADLPPVLSALARDAVGPAPPNFRTALALEGYLRRNYRVATGEQLPTGHGYPQLQYFLTTSKRGTSEQFATGYVLLARSLGLPARLVVGFRQPTAAEPGNRYTVRNADVLAWPEVRVTGLGWVPLDPTAQAGAGRAGGGLGAATEQARNAPPPPVPAAPTGTPDRRAPEAAPATRAAARPAGVGPAHLGAAGVATALLLAGAAAAVPLAKRRRTRRRRRGHPVPVIAGAWLEVRDRLLDHGVPVRRGATVRDVAADLPAFVDEPTRAGLRRLAHCVDRALWSPEDVPPRLVRQSWQAVAMVSAALA
ncbi:MAG TPA: transglutaminaseTgpA domain-containing protein, partial [Catenuloplanes sp.]